LYVCRSQRWAVYLYDIIRGRKKQWRIASCAPFIPQPYAIGL
jgi:hypothetical protein